jgi:hypothetical protein
MSLQPYIPPKHRLQAVMARDQDIEEGDAAARAAEAVEHDRDAALAEVEAGIAELAQQARRPVASRRDEIAELVLALTYGEMIAIVAEIMKAGNLPPDGKDLAKVLHVWASGGAA